MDVTSAEQSDRTQNPLTNEESGQSGEQCTDGSSVAPERLGLSPMNFGSGEDIHGEIGGCHSRHNQALQQNLISIKVRRGATEPPSSGKDGTGAHGHLPKRDENESAQSSKESRATPLRSDPQQQKDNHILKKESNAPDEEFASRQRIKMRVKMEKLRSEQGPKGEGVKIAASKVPEKIEGPTRRQIDLMNLLVQPENEVPNDLDHLALPPLIFLYTGTSSRTGLRMVKTKGRKWNHRQQRRASLIIGHNARHTAPNAKEPSREAEGVIDSFQVEPSGKKGSDFSDFPVGVSNQHLVRASPRAD